MKLTLPLDEMPTARHLMMVVAFRPTLSSRRISDLSLLTDEEDPTTISKSDASKPNVEPLPRRIMSRDEVPLSHKVHHETKKVRFDEDDDRVYYKKSLVNEVETHELWYTDKELSVLRDETREAHRTLAAFEKARASPSSWSNILKRIYFVKSEQIPIYKATFRETGLGMEKRVIPSIARDAFERRKRQLASISQWQKAPLRDEDFRAEMIRRSCSTLSQPSRVFARHLAEMAFVAK